MLHLEVHGTEREHERENARNCMDGSVDSMGDGNDREHGRNWKGASKGWWKLKETEREQARAWKGA